MSDNLSSYFESALPGVYINKIVLNVANEKWESLFNKNPHIQKPALEPEWSAEAKNLSGTSEESLDVFVDFSLKAKVPKGRDLVSSFLFNEDFLKFYKIKIISVESESAYSGMHASNERVKDLVAGQKTPPGAKSTTISLSDTSFFKLTDDEDILDHIKDYNKTIDNNGNIIYDIPFRHTISVKEVSPSHLSLFVVPYLDIDEIKQNFGLKGDDEVEILLGQHIDEPIIRGGKLVTQKTIYRQTPTAEEIIKFSPSEGNAIAKGKIWHGPVHYHGPGSGIGYIGWMGGKAHNPKKNQPKLTAEMVYNRTVQDFRTLKRIERQIFDFREVENKKLGQNVITFPINDNLDISRKPSYFSELFTSKDREGKCRFFFSVDYLTMVKKNSAFPILFENSSPSFISQLLRKSYIRSFKILRNRVDSTASSVNKLGTKRSVEFDRNIPPEMLVHTKDNEIGLSSGPGFGGRSARLQPGKRIVEVGDDPGICGTNRSKEVAATVQEVNLMTQEFRSDYPFMRHFAAVDHMMSEITNGFYRYDVEIEIEDPTVNFMEERLQELVNITTTFEKYYNVAVSQNISSPETVEKSHGFNQAGRRKYKLNYSLVAQSFIPEFLDDILQLFSEGSIAENTLLNNVAQSAKKHSGQNNILTDIITQYVDIFQLLTKGFQPQSQGAGPAPAEDHPQQNLIREIAKMVDPVVGSPEGIGSFLKLVSDLSINVERMLDSAISGPVTKDAPSGPGSEPQSLKVDATRTFKVIKEFSNFEDIFDSDTSKYFGVDYLTSEPSTNEFGLMLLNTGDFRERSNFEMRKYFGKKTGTLHLDKDFQGGVRLGLDPLKFAYFSPMSISTRKGVVYDLLSEALKQANKFYEPHRYNQILIEALRYNNGLNIDKDPYPIGRNLVPKANAMQRLRGGLIDFMASKSCTVSSMESFNVHVEDDQISDYCQETTPFTDIIKFTSVLSALPLVAPLAGHGVNKNTPQGVYVNDLTNPNKALLKLSSYFSHPTYKFDPYAHFNIDSPVQRVFDLDVAGDLSNYPNQYKAMIAVCTQKSKPKEEHDLALDLEREVFNPNKKSDSLGFFYLNFMNLCSVEMLTGYRIVDGTGKNEAQMSDPLFQQIGMEQWERINSNEGSFKMGDRDNRLVCRVKRHSNSQVNIPEIEAFDFPIYNKHFFMKPGKPKNNFAAALNLNTPPISPAAAAAIQAAAPVLAAVGAPTAGQIQIAAATAAAVTSAAETAIGLSPGTLPGGFLPSSAKIIPTLGQPIMAGLKSLSNTMMKSTIPILTPKIGGAMGAGYIPPKTGFDISGIFDSAKEKQTKPGKKKPTKGDMY